MEPGDQVYRHIVCIPFNDKCLYEKECSITALSVLGANDVMIVLDDEDFTRVMLTKCNYEIYIESPSLSIRDNDRFFACVRYVLYSVKRRRMSAIKKYIEKELQKKSAFYASIDLSFIK